MRTYVLKYGVRRITENGEAARDEAWAAHQYYNQLLKIRLGERHGFREVRQKFCPEFVWLEAESDAVKEQLSDFNQAAKRANQKASAPQKGKKARPKRLPLSDEQKLQLKGLKAERDRIKPELKAARDAFNEMLRPAQTVYESRVTGATVELIEMIGTVGKQLKEAKRESGNPEVAMLKRKLSELKAQRDRLAPKTQARGEAKKQVAAAMLEEPEWPECWKAQLRNEREAHTLALEARDVSGLTSGTYAAVENAVAQAFKTSKADPRTRRFDGGRKIGRQIQGGISFTDALSCTTNELQIKNLRSPEGRKHDPTPRRPGSRRDRARYATVRFPIGKGKERQWLDMEVNIHRQIPDDASITWVYLVPRRVGLRTAWTLQLTINVEQPLIQRAAGSGNCDVSVRFSRRRVDHDKWWLDRIVVANLNGEPFELDGDDYRAGSPSSQLRGGAFAAILYARIHRSIADRRFDLARDELRSWVHGAQPEESWLRKQISYRAGEDDENEPNGKKRGQQDISQWRNHGRLALVARAWIKRTVGAERAQELWKLWRAHHDGFAKAQRFGDKKPGDYLPENAQPVLDFLEDYGVIEEEHRWAVWLEFWRRKDHHLVTVAGELDRKGRNCRKDQYRCKAAQLATQYDTITLPKKNIAQLGEKALPYEEAKLTDELRGQLRAAAPGEFLDAIRHVFGKDRVRHA